MDLIFVNFLTFSPISHRISDKKVAVYNKSARWKIALTYYHILYTKVQKYMEREFDVSEFYIAFSFSLKVSTQTKWMVISHCVQ